ncbi:MAG: PEGA domain-containing protein, partial [Pirellulales bacterium]|nr:PEGA domain-containing protein [Pirellulales bacterium]
MVSVDGKQLGLSPADLAQPLALEVTPGKHDLKITKEGFEDIETQFTAEARTPLELTIKLAALPAIETSPAHKLLRWVFDSQGTATLL